MKYIYLIITFIGMGSGELFAAEPFTVTFRPACYTDKAPAKKTHQPWYKNKTVRNIVYYGIPVISATCIAVKLCRWLSTAEQPRVLQPQYMTQSQTINGSIRINTSSSFFSPTVVVVNPMVQGGSIRIN